MINLSNREKQVLDLIAHEHTVHEIAEKLYISSSTAHSHRKNLFRKMQVKNMAGLVRRGFELGLLQVSNMAKASFTIIFLLSAIQISFSQDNEQQFIDQTTVDYDNCTGIAKVKFPVRENYSICGQANNLRHITIYDLNITNGLAAVYAISKDYVTGVTCTTPDDGQFTILGCRTYDKCKFGGTASMQIVNGVGDQRFAEITIPNLDDDAFGGDIEFGFSGWYDLECCEGTTAASSFFGFELNFNLKWNNGELSATIDNNTPSISSISAEDCNTTTINWNNQSDPGGCSGANWTTEIWRSVQGENNFIKVGEKKLSPFTDNNPTYMMTEGVTYEYKLRPRWTVGQRTDYGNFSGVISVTIPDHDGRISGKVVTLAGDGVEGVLVKAILTNPDDLTGCPDITAPVDGYMVTTESDGTYLIQNVYYGIANDPDANYTVVGILEGHDIDTAFNVMLSDENPGVTNNRQNVDLTDSSAITLAGVVTDGLCPIDSVNVQGFSTNPMSTFLIVPTVTDDTGKYELTLPGPGEYDVKITYRNYTETKTITVDLDPPDVDFVYPDTAVIRGYVVAGCQEFIGTSQVQALSNGCIIATTDTDNNGYYEMTVPRRDLNIVVGPFTPEPGSGLSGSLGDNKSISIESDTTTLDFVFRKPVAVTFSNLPGPTCSALPYPLLKQREKYPVVFDVTEGGTCPADTGFVMITDFIGSNDQVSQFDTMVPISNGKAYYTVVAGDPNVLSPFRKSITYVAHVGDQNSGAQTQQVIVTGAVKRGNTFATTSPQMPYLILRDPPGDGSYAFLEQSQKITLSQSFSTLLGGGVNVWAKAKAGVDIFSLKVWGEIGASLDISGSTTTSDEFVLEMESLQRFETSDDQNVVGPRGDVFVGAAINLIYAKADILEFDFSSCSLNLDTVIMVDNDGFETEFVYTDGHIRNTVIPNLQELYDNSNDANAKFEYQRSIKVWEQVLELNDDLKAEALMQDSIDNISFNSGDGAITRSYTESSTQTRTIEFQTIIDATIAAEAGFEIAGSGLSGGVAVNFRTEIGSATSSSISTSTTTGYVFEDDDNSQNGTSKDDSWTVDVVTDPVYGTPVFRLKAGETSCPWEEGTAKRFKPVMTVANPIIYAAPGVDEVNFQFELSNQSETNEAGNYTLELVNSSNPGAIVTLNAANLTSSVINFHPLSRGTIFRNVKVKRDLTASDYAYEGLKFLFYPTCARDEAVSVSISAFFDNPCSDIVLSAPADNWVVNDNSNNQLPITISGYDLASNFSEVRLEYALPGENVWNPTNIILAKNQLSSSPSGTTVNWNTSGIADGAYDIRLRLQCSSAFNYSERRTGVIDRSAPVVYGVEQPLDDILDAGDKISVHFNEKIQCGQLSNANLTLKMIPQNTMVSAQLNCDNQEITVEPLDDILMLVNQRFEVEITGVEDLYGNAISTPIEWTFAIGDPDSDGDGIPNSMDRCPGGNDFEDTDFGGIPDDCDCAPLNSTNDGVDADCDNIADFADLCPDLVDAALNFNGIGQHVMIPHHPELNVLDGDFTFTAWVTPVNQTFAAREILSKGLSIWIFNIYQDKIALFVNGQWQYSDTNVPVETWSHVAVTYDHSENTLIFYLNGMADGTRSFSVPVTSNNDALPMYIGRQGDQCNCNFFRGKIDELSIWNKALSPGEITSVMTNTASKNAAGLVAAYSFNDNQPFPYTVTEVDTLSERTGNHHGSLVNFDTPTSAWGYGINRIENCVLCSDILELTAATGELEGVYEAGIEIKVMPGALFTPGKSVTLSAPSVSMEMDVNVPQTSVLNITQDGCND